MRSPRTQLDSSPLSTQLEKSVHCNQDLAHSKNKLTKKGKEIAVIFHYLLLHITDVIMLIVVLLKTRSRMQKRWQDMGE